MTVERVELLVEEPSMEAALRMLLPGMLRDVSFEIYPHQCKDDLLQRLPARLQGYSKWIPDAWRILVVVDRDDDNCDELKHRLEHVAAKAGLRTRTNSERGLYVLVNRLAIEELEAWFFGDWDAVREAYPRVPATIPQKARFRDPDAIQGGTWEALERILQSAGYFTAGLRKIEAAREIARCMDPDRNRSVSFAAFRDVLREMSTT